MLDILALLGWIIIIFILARAAKELYDNSKNTVTSLDKIRKEIEKLADKVSMNEETLNLLIALTQKQNGAGRTVDNQAATERINEAIKCWKDKELERQKKEDTSQRINEMKRPEGPNEIKFNWPE